MSCHMTRFQRLEAAGWSMLHDDAHSETWYRYRAAIYPKRDELHVVLDRAGNLYAWSIWTSERITAPDQSKGRRERMFRYAEIPA